MIGNIIKKRQIAIGIDTCAHDSLSRKSAKCGPTAPIAVPTRIDRKTQKGQEMLKKWIVFVQP
jgi:hypothetical protein